MPSGSKLQWNLPFDQIGPLSSPTDHVVIISRSEQLMSSIMLCCLVCLSYNSSVFTGHLSPRPCYVTPKQIAIHDFISTTNIMFWIIRQLHAKHWMLTATRWKEPQYCWMSNCARRIQKRSNSKPKNKNNEMSNSCEWLSIISTLWGPCCVLSSCDEKKRNKQQSKYRDAGVLSNQ